MKSIKTKIITIVLSCIIVSCSAVGSASIINSRRAVSYDSAQIMNLLCANRAEEINNLFSSIEQSVETLKVYATDKIESVQRIKDDPDYVDAYSESLLDVAINAAQNTQGALTVYIRFNPAFTDPESGIFCSKDSKNGKFQALAPTNLSLYESADIEHVGWFYVPAKKKTGTWMAPYFNQNIQVEMISYVVPVYVNSTFVGVVGMDIDFGILEEVVGSTQLYQTGYAFLTDSEAKIVSHKELERGTDLLQFNNGGDVASSLIQRREPG